MRHNSKLLISSLTMLAMGVAAQAVIVAQDNAGDAAYAGGWTTGTNGGTGFGAWTIDLMQYGGNPYIATNSDVNIPNGGPAWGLGSLTQPTEWDWTGVIAKRSFNTPMGVGDVFHADFDNGEIPLTGAGSGFTFGFMDSTNAELASVYVWQASWWPMGPNYQIGGGGDTGIAMTYGGVHLRFKVTGADTFEIGLTPTGAAESLFLGTFKNALTGPVAGIELRGYNNGEGTNHDFYVNNMMIDAVPEPGTVAVLGLGLAWLARRRKA